MANALYDSGRERFAGHATEAIDWLSGSIIVILASAGYIYSPAHTHLSDVPAGSRVATSGGLSGKSTAAGVCDANDVTYTEVSGSTITQVLLVQYSGVESTSPLIGRIDTATNLPITPNGGDINIVWSDGPNKIFKL